MLADIFEGLGLGKLQRSLAKMTSEFTRSKLLDGTRPRILMIGGGSSGMPIV